MELNGRVSDVSMSVECTHHWLGLIIYAQAGDSLSILHNSIPKVHLRTFTCLSTPHPEIVCVCGGGGVYFNMAFYTNFLYIPQTF